MNAVFKPMLSPNGQVQYNGSAYELVSTGTTLDDLDAPAGGAGAGAANGAEPGKAAETKKPWWRKVFSRKTFIIAATLLVLTGVFIGLVYGGIALRDNRVRIVRTINRAFDSDITGSGNASQALLVVEQRYQTLDATKLYFEPGSGFNFLVYLYLVPDPSNLDDRTLLMKFTEPSSLHGSMQDGQTYYVSRLHRLTCKYNTVPSIVFLPSSADDIDVTRSWRSVITTTSLSSTGTRRKEVARRLVWARGARSPVAARRGGVSGPAGRPGAVLASIFPNRKNYAYGLIHRHSLVPSPSTRVAAAMVTMIAAEEVDSTGAPIPHKPRYYYSAMTFFNMYTGVLEGAVAIRTCACMPADSNEGGTGVPRRIPPC